MLALWSCGRRGSVVQAQRQIHRAFAGSYAATYALGHTGHAEPPNPLAPPRKIGREEIRRGNRSASGSIPGEAMRLPIQICRATRFFISVSSLSLGVAQLSCLWLALASLALFEPIAVAVHFEDVDVVGQSVAPANG